MESEMSDALFVLIYLIYYLFALAYGAYAYIGVGLGGFRMATKAGMDKPWMFWVPVANIYAVGALADREAALCEGKMTNYRKKLLAWNIVVIAMVFVLVFSLIPFIAVAAANGMMEEDGTVRYPEAEAEALAIPALIFLGTLLAFLALCIVYMVFYYIVLHKIYKLYAPDGAAGLTVLSVFVDIAIPAIFLILSKREPVLPYSAQDVQSMGAPDISAHTGEDFYTLP